MRSCVWWFLLPALSFSLMDWTRYKELFCSQHLIISWRDVEKRAWIHSQVFSIRFCKCQLLSLVLRCCTSACLDTWCWGYMEGKEAGNWAMGLMRTPGTGGWFTGGWFFPSVHHTAEQCQIQGFPRARKILANLRKTKTEVGPALSRRLEQMKFLQDSIVP